MENNLPQDSSIDKRIEITPESVIIPIIEEHIKIGKKVIETGKIRVSKTIKQENEFINVPLIHEEIDIKRIPINQYVDTLPDAVRYDGDTMIIPVLKEVYVMRTMLVEEIHINKKRVQTQDAQNVSLRKEEVRIENIEPDIKQNPNQ